MAGAMAVTMQAPYINSFTQAGAGDDQTPHDDARSQASEKTPPTQEKKSKRVRSGCLTCRDRHLKCDEGRPNCQNCTKSNRECSWGLRINWINAPKDEEKDRVPHLLLPPTKDYAVSFQDESRDIASEYVGGLERYPSQKRPRMQSSYTQQQHYAYHHRPSYSDISSDHSGPSAYGPMKAYLDPNAQAHHNYHNSTPPDMMPAQESVNAFMDQHSQQQYAHREQRDLQASDESDYLRDQEQVFFDSITS